MEAGGGGGGSMSKASVLVFSLFMVLSEHRPRYPSYFLFLGQQYCLWDIGMEGGRGRQRERERSRSKASVLMFSMVVPEYRPRYANKFVPRSVLLLGQELLLCF